MRFGLVGYGFGGRYFHAPLLASAPDIDFAGVVTRSPERRAELGKDQPGAAAYDSLRALAADGVQAVAISTPADTHIPLALEAIALGMAVVVDKPFALDAAEARTAVDAAEQAGVPLSVYQNRRWDSDLLTVRHLIGTGALGDVSRFESRFERFSPDPGPPAAGGGNLRDFGAHLVDQALLLFGPAEHVYARMTAKDDDCFVSIQHTGGVESQLWGSWIQGAPGPRFRVTGATGTYIVGGVDGQEEALIAGRTPATEGDRWGTEPEDRWGHVYRGGAGEPVPTERGRWDTYYPAFAAAVRGEGPLPVDPWDVVRNIEVLDAARASASTGATIML
ncbi:oxidoreductase [Asanoa ishikariensis]|uniref:Predicted dehydrogenase n=1 Tax=Asanoa ishikariensis TaxID=137265 RepID=A0A1H3TAB4_9ACTN|nr:Gfo/Idh/MocA family oxidoreductase [Asanoa ishikariensis]GIF62831.1 oxidoreductase [Asanoa ishikariensis]SDZ46808.1 Predicted dehydrogenase [Asanoa ishikariensis]